MFESLDQGASKTEIFINKYQKLLVGLISGIVIVFVLYFGYDKLIYQPKVDESNAELFTAQKYFNLAVEAAETSDSLYNLSLNGADGKYGFLDIIEDYSGTPAANISNYSAGIAYFNLKKYDLAIKYLNDFSSDDEFLGTLALSTIGDSFVQLNQLDDGLNYYEKALSTTANSFLRPIILDKSGSICLRLNKKNKAKKSTEILASELLFTHSKRVNTDGFSHKKNNDWQITLERSFPYKETGDQEKSIKEIYADMEKSAPMDRLLCGDVGFGKTEDRKSTRLNSSHSSVSRMPSSA